MSLVVPNISDVLMLQYIVNMIAQDGGAAPSGGERLLKLFVNEQYLHDQFFHVYIMLPTNLKNVQEYNYYHLV